jgi:hypothetical protein
VYESLFPDLADRVVLEGNVDPTEVWAGSAAGWGEGMAERFPDAARVAAQQDPALGAGPSPEQVTRTFLALADRLDRTPAPLPGTELALSGALLCAVTYGLLLENDHLPVLAQFWKAAADLADGAPTAAVLQQVLADAPATPGHPRRPRGQPDHHVPGSELQ